MRMMVAVSAPGLPSAPAPFQGLSGHLVEVGSVDSKEAAARIALAQVQNDWDIPASQMHVTGVRLKSRN